MPRKTPALTKAIELTPIFFDPPHKSTGIPQLTTILRAVEERLTALEAAIASRSAPAAEIRQGLDDILRIYGITAQTGEVLHGQREQIQALAEAMTMFHGRLIEQDHRALAERLEILTFMNQLRQLASDQGIQLDHIEHSVDLLGDARAAGE